MYSSTRGNFSSSGCAAKGPAAAAMIEPLAVTVHAVRTSSLAVGDTACVLGGPEEDLEYRSPTALVPSYPWVSSWPAPSWPWAWAEPVQSSPSSFAARSPWYPRVGIDVVRAYLPWTARVTALPCCLEVGPQDHVRQQLDHQAGVAREKGS